MVRTILVLIPVLLLAGCLGTVPSCDSPYSLVNNKCCLDMNRDKICDLDIAALEAGRGFVKRDAEKEEAPEPEPEVEAEEHPALEFNCDLFVKKQFLGDDETGEATAQYTTKKGGNCTLKNTGDTSLNQVKLNEWILGDFSVGREKAVVYGEEYEQETCDKFYKKIEGVSVLKCKNWPFTPELGAAGVNFVAYDQEGKVSVTKHFDTPTLVWSVNESAWVEEQ